jgi:hypothetical protein
MARKELKDKNKQIRDDLEQLALDHLGTKLKILQDERVLKETMDITPLEPKFKFETDKKWLELMRRGHIQSTDEQILMIKQKMFEIELGREAREEHDKRMS